MHKQHTIIIYLTDPIMLLHANCVYANTINIATVNTSNCWSKTPIAKWTMDDKCQLVRFVDNCIQPAHISYVANTIDIPWVKNYDIFMSYDKKRKANVLGLRMLWSSYSCVMKLRLQTSRCSRLLGRYKHKFFQPQTKLTCVALNGRQCLFIRNLIWLQPNTF
jgi:hypothetical protein